MIGLLLVEALKPAVPTSSIDHDAAAATTTTTTTATNNNDLIFRVM